MSEETLPTVPQGQDSSRANTKVFPAQQSSASSNETGNNWEEVFSSVTN